MLPRFLADARHVEVEVIRKIPTGESLRRCRSKGQGTRTNSEQSVSGLIWPAIGGGGGCRTVLIVWETVDSIRVALAAMR
jgi:hypothetical protein